MTDYPAQWILDETRLEFGAWRTRQARLHINSHYRDMDAMYGMDYWRGLYSSFILGDMAGVNVGMNGYPEYNPLITAELERFAIDRIEAAYQKCKEIFTI